MTDLQDQIEMAKRQEILSKHTFKIWLGEDGNWHTYLPDKEKGRVPKKRKNKKDLEEIIYLYWKEEVENPTVEDVFHEWVNEKLENKEIIPATKMRYEVDFERYFLDDRKFGKEHIKDITEDDLEIFIRKSIVKYNLTSKGYSNLRLLVYGIFKRAKKKVNFSVTNLVRDMEISKRSFKKVIKEDYEEVFDEDEFQKVVQHLQNNQDTINLGLLLIFATGMRVGELSTLKASDWKNGYISIRRTETIYKDESNNYIYDIKEFPKTDAGIRDIAVPTSSAWIINKLISMNSNGEYLFESKGKRIKALTFRKRIKSICSKLDIYEKSPHKIRKTYGSILLDNSIDKKLILDQMGHVEILTTEVNYHRNRKTANKKIEILDNIPDLSIN